MYPEDTIAAVLCDPEVLWAIRSSPVVVLGPWVEAREVKPDGTFGSGTPGGKWRKPPRKNVIGADGATVSKSQPLSSQVPQEYQFTRYEYEYDDEGDFDQESFDEAVEVYNAIAAVWKPYRYSIRMKLEDGTWFEDSGYADTLDEGMTLADAVLRSKGVLLV